MEHPVQQKRRLISPRTGTILGIIVIALAVIGVFLTGPREPESSTLFGEPLTQPTVEITNLAETLPLKSEITYKGVQVKFTKAMLAAKFSDGRRRGGPYTVRIQVETSNTTKEMVGVEYAKLVHLLTPTNSVIDSNLISIHAVEIPNQPQRGFIDFPVTEKYALKNLKLRFNGTEIPLSAG